MTFGPPQVFASETENIKPNEAGGPRMLSMEKA
jgi:hypothetical protein